MAWKTRVRVAEDINVRGRGGVGYCVCEIVNLLAAVQGAPGDQDIFCPDFSECSVSSIVLGLHNEVHVVFRIILVENGADVFCEFRVDSFAGTKNGNALVRFARFRADL